MLEVPELGGSNPQLQKAMAKLVQAEDRPLKRFDEKKGVEENRLKLVRDFKTKATEAKDAAIPFKSPMDFRELAGTSSFPEVLNVTSVDKTLAQPGSYDIEVIQLACSNSLSTYGFPDKDKSEVGVGYISFETATGESKDVYISSDNNTLEGVAKSINRANVGVKAMVVNDGSDADENWRLIISGEKTGWKNDIKWPEFHMLDGDFDLDVAHNREAQSAIIKFNGEPIMVDDNKVKDLMPGVTFDLKKVQPGQSIKLEIKPDYEKIEGKAKTMVDKLNAMLTFIQQQNQLDSKSSKDPTKALGGDVTLHTIESELRNLVQTTQSSMSDSEVRQMRDLGIGFKRDGSLEYDAKMFQSKLENHFDDVVTFFTGNEDLNGFGSKLEKILEGVTRTGDGMMTIKEKGLQTKIDDLAKQRDFAESRAQEHIEHARAQFGKAEAAIQEMQNMGGPNGIASMISRGS